MKDISTTDWSRYARNKRKLELIDSDQTQSKITTYFDVLDKVSLLLKENKVLSNMLCELLNGSHKQSEPRNQTDSKSVIHQLLLNIERNTTKHPKHRQHNEVMKKFATILYIYSGSMAYEFIHRNIPDGLPSLRTVQSIVYSQYTRIQEGEFLFEGLKEHLKKHGACPVVAIAEDATRIINRVEYDPATNRCVGFVLPSDKNGLPVTDSSLWSHLKVWKTCSKPLQFPSMHIYT